MWWHCSCIIKAFKITLLFFILDCRLILKILSSHRHIKLVLIPLRDLLRAHICLSASSHFLLLLHQIVEKLTTLIETISPLDRLLQHLLLSEAHGVLAEWFVWKLIVDQSQTTIISTACSIKGFLVCHSFFDVLFLFLLSIWLHLRGDLDRSLSSTSMSLGC